MANKIQYINKNSLAPVAISLCVIFTLLLDQNLAFFYPTAICFFALLSLSTFKVELNGFTLFFLVSWLITATNSIGFGTISSLLFLYLLLSIRLTGQVLLNCKLIGGFLYLQIGFAVCQIFYPEVIKSILGLISDDRINILDYSNQPLAAFRVQGLFTNPNTAALSMLVTYSLLLLNSRYTGFLTHFLVTICIAAFGSRAGFLSIVIITLMFSVSLKGIRTSAFCITILAIWAAFQLGMNINLRVFDLYGLLTLEGKSSNIRISIIQDYIAYLDASQNLLILTFGHGFLNPRHYFFDGDVGNILYLFGVFGAFTSLTLLALKLGRSGYIWIMIYLSPFIMGGGILGNQKFAFIILLLTLVRLPKFQRADLQ
jgi:hypothetical protein